MLISRLIAATLLALLVTTAAHAKAPVVPLDELVPNKQQAHSTALITRFMTRYHYKKLAVDDKLSQQVLERYLELLDPNRSYFLVTDIQSFQGYKYQLDNALRTGQLDPPFHIFRVFRQRVEDRVAYAASLLQRNFKFDIDEDFTIDREEAPWAKTQADLDELWRKRVKNDILTLRLSHKEPDEIKETLTKRYASLGRRTRSLDSGDIYQFFINAYTSAVEPHTSYFSPQTSDNFRIQMSLSLEGIGAALQTEDEYTMVRRIIAGGPADKSDQLHVDDRIIGVGQDQDDIQDVIGWPLDDVVELIRGKKGTVVRLRILPKESGLDGASREITLVRNKIKLEEQAAKSSIIEGAPFAPGHKIGVIELPAFYMDFAAKARGDEDFRSTTRDVKNLITELKQQDIDALIIDLRGNSGGSLQEATALTGLFIPNGPVVQVRDSDGKLDVNEDPDPALFYDGPMAVLVDQQSASASEIFAAAIQDYRRGLIIGEPTFGKGTVQTLVNLDRYAKDPELRLGQLKLTIAQYFRIDGGSTQNKGVIPDIIYPTAVDTTDRGESGMDNALPWTTVKAADYLVTTHGSDHLDKLREQHSKRIANDAGFAFLMGEVELREEARKRKQVSLLESKRITERKRREVTLLDQENTFRSTRGLKPRTLEELEASKEDKKKHGEDQDKEEEYDILLEEASRILGDYISDQGTFNPGQPRLGVRTP